MSYNIYRVAKPTGGYRIIAEPDEAVISASKVWLNKIQTCVSERAVISHEGLKYYSHDRGFNQLQWFRLLLLDRQYAYTPGRSAKQLVDKVYEFTADMKDFDIFYFDVKDFFGSITKDLLYKLSNKSDMFIDWPVTCQRDCDTIWDLIHPTEAPFKADKGIAQGNPLSPLVANLLGIHIDHQLVYACSRYYKEEAQQVNTTSGGITADVVAKHMDNNFCYLRYSDNIFIIARPTSFYSRSVFLKFLLDVINSDSILTKVFTYKAEVRGNHQKNMILGMRLGATRAQLADKKWLRTLFYRIDKLGPLCMTHKDIEDRFGKGLAYPKFLEKVQGLVAYILSIDPGMEDYIMKHAGEYLYPTEVQELKEL